MRKLAENIRRKRIRSDAGKKGAGTRKERVEIGTEAENKHHMAEILETLGTVIATHGFKDTNSLLKTVQPFARQLNMLGIVKLNELLIALKLVAKKLTKEGVDELITRLPTVFAFDEEPYLR